MVFPSKDVLTFRLALLTSVALYHSHGGTEIIDTSTWAI